MSGGTHVSANQGGCTCWCDDCRESHNCENWDQDRTLRWLKQHPKECSIGRQKRIRSRLDDLQDLGVPAKVLRPIRVYADSLHKAGAGSG